MALGTLALRLTVGGLMTAHGLQKLTGAFGGPGIDAATGMMRSLGLHPARRNALAASWSETAGGAAIALGLATPAAAAAVIGSMTTAIRTVHLKNGVWSSKGGYEYNAVLIAAAVAIAADGPGPISLDALLGRSKWGVAAGLVALAAGVGGSFAITELAKRQPEAAAEPPAAPARES